MPNKLLALAPLALLALALFIPNASAAAPSDCVPAIRHDGVYSIFVTCDSSGQPCGIVQTPVCWSFRYACMNALIVVLHLYDSIHPIPDDVNPHSSCEGQPGWEPGSGAASNAATTAAATDCIPQVQAGPDEHLEVACDGSGAACGIAQSPVCWTVRYACMNALVSVLRLYDSTRHIVESNMVPEQPSSCEGQPGWP